ncbi:MAG TPA: glutathione S-transferase family protein [Gaiellaceae bacterium]|nr:glutathione S-transferase family protein [Gaiellaceae bacterium]
MGVQRQEVVLIRCLRIPFSTNVERVALAAGHKGVPIEWVDVDEDDRSPVEEVSGQPLVPVLVAGDEVVTDSPRILDWLEDRFPEPSLLPREPAHRAEVRIFADWFNRVWKIFPNGINDGVGDGAAHTAEMRRAVTLFESLLAGRDFLFGELGLADVTAFPFLKYASLGLSPGDEDSFHTVLAEQVPLDADSPLHAWVARVDALPRS